jgi:signal peptidase II
LLATIVIVLLVFLDQLVKYLVKTNIPLGSSVPFLPGILGLTHIHNTGAAFSMLSGARWFFVILTVSFVIFGMWVLLTGRLRHPLGKWSWVLVLAGAIGNLIDRCLYGYVVDMFEVQFMHFAIFNVADIFVVVGGILFCIYYLFLHDKKKEDAPHDPSV